jgi:hypothetical protein
VLVLGLALAVLALLWLVRRLARRAYLAERMLFIASQPTQTSSTCVDRVSYTVPVPRTLSLGPVEVFDHQRGGE